MTFQKEADFEEALIKVLADKGWEKEVIKNPTEQDLIRNWAKILYDNNRGIDRLNNYICPDGVAAAGKAAYVERNQAMIQASDFCVFYFNDEYLPESRKESKIAITSYQPKSGTRLAFDYAKANGKTIINLYTEDEHRN